MLVIKQKSWFELSFKKSNQITTTCQESKCLKIGKIVEAKCENFWQKLTFQRHVKEHSSSLFVYVITKWTLAISFFVTSKPYFLLHVACHIDLVNIICIFIKFHNHLNLFSTIHPSCTASLFISLLKTHIWEDRAINFCLLKLWLLNSNIGHH